MCCSCLWFKRKKYGILNLEYNFFKMFVSCLRKIFFEVYLIIVVFNCFNVCLVFFWSLYLFFRVNEMLRLNIEKFNEGDLIVCVKVNMVY